jgi:VanZ family protein
MAIQHFLRSRRSLFFAALLILHTAFTLISPFYTVPIVVWLMKHKLYRITIGCMAAPLFFLLLFFSVKRWKLIKADRRLILILVATVFSYITVYETVPDLGEKLHVLNFSVLALFAYKMLSPQMKLHWALLISWIFSSSVAGVDEYLQNFIVGRAGTVHDVLIAVRSAILGGIIAWIFDAYSRKGR